MKKIVILLIIMVSFNAIESYGQVPVTPTPAQEENKFGEFKILTPEEARKISDVEAEKTRLKQMELDQAQAIMEKKIAKAKKKNNPARKVIFGVLGSILGGAILGYGIVYLVTGEII